MSWLFALFLVAHALIHASFVAPRPAATSGGPEWPFELTKSWILSPLGLDGDVGRAVGIALLAVIVVAFVVAAAAVFGVIGEGLFAPGVVAGAVASLAMLVLFFHPWLALGLVIDVVLLWAVLVQRWSPVSGPLG